jgi:catechol 2,3-dioxygenase-like lactoylglutathione lyase family enzyme
MHVNAGVTHLDDSIRFYSSLFGAVPTVVRGDYAKWMLDDPRVNFAITSRGTKKGIDHLGIQVESRSELSEVYGRLRDAEAPLIDQGPVTCCYAASEKHWSYDPEGVAWETFLTTGASVEYGSERDVPRANTCCDRPAADAQAAPKACCAGEIRTGTAA